MSEIEVVTARQYVSLEAAAGHAGVSLRTIQRLVASGELPAARFGRSVRIDLGELEALGRRTIGAPLVRT